MAKVADTSFERTPIKVAPSKTADTATAPKAIPGKTGAGKPQVVLVPSTGGGARQQQQRQENASLLSKIVRQQTSTTQRQQSDRLRQQQKQDNAALVARAQERARDRQRMEQTHRKWLTTTDAGRQQQRQENAALVSEQQRQSALVASYGDVSQQSAADVFHATPGGSGGIYGSQRLDSLRQQLGTFYTEEVMPRYKNYQNTLKDYNAGKATADQLEDARLAYASAYYQYTPAYRAYEMVRQGGIPTTGDSKALRDAANQWNAAGIAASNAVTASGERLAQAKEAYEKAYAAFLEDPSTGFDTLDELGLAYEEAAGRYNADLFVLQEISEIGSALGRRYTAAAERERQEYYDAHPYALRSDDTHESIAERTAVLKADYEAAEKTLREAEKRYTADSDAEAFGVGAGFSAASKADYDAALDSYNTARLNYERTKALDDWASDPTHLESRNDWERNGWTWDDRFRLYQETGDDRVLDDLIYGYGSFMADDKQRDELKQVVEQQFQEAKADRIPDVATVPREVREASEELYREAQDRLHMVGGVATSARDLADATFWTVVTDVASLGALALDATTLAVQAFAPETARWMQNWSNGIKADRLRVQEQMSREVANMPYAGAMAIQLVPSVIECLGSAWYAKFLQGAATVASPTSLAAAAQYEANVAKASNWSNVIQASMQDMARNPQYWTSFARVAGTDYVDAVNDGASQMQAMAYALADGSLNALIEIGGEGIQSLPRVAEELTDPTMRKVLREVYLKSVFDEGMEEVYQGVVERGLSALLLGTGNKLVGLTGTEADREAIFSFVSALEEFAGGAAVSAIVSSPTALQKMLEGGKRESFIRLLNTENLALPEDLRLAPLNVQECTDNEVADFYLTLALRKLQNSVINESEDYNAAHQTERAEATSYYEEAQQRAEKANPDNSVLSPIATELQEKGYGDARGAEVQAELLGKVLDGETLTDAEVRAFELNNDLVRTVFRERTGLTGMPETGDFDAKTRRVYIDAARTLANRVKAAQTALAETTGAKPASKPVSTVAEAQTGSEAAKGNSSKGLDLLKRKLNKEIRRARGKNAQEAAITENKRHRDIRTEGRTLEQVFEGVQRQSGIDSILTYEEFRKSDMARSTSTGTDEASEALNSLDILGQYYSYLTGMGLTRSEADAIMRVQPLTKSESSAYTEKKTVKEDVKDGRSEGADDGGDTESVRRVGGSLPDGESASAAGGPAEPIPGAGSEQPGGQPSGPGDTDSSGTTLHPDDGEREETIAGESNSRLTSFSEEEKELVKRVDPDVKIDHWTDAPISQLSEAEATLFNKIADWIINLSGAKVFLVNTNSIGVDPYYNPDAKKPRPPAHGLTLRGDPSGLFIAADLQHRPTFSPARTLAHEGLHALIRKFGGKEIRGKLRTTVMMNPTLLKGYDAFKKTPAGEFYVAHFSADTVYEEYAAKVFAHTYGTEAEQKLIAKFVKDNIPGFPIEEYTKQMKELDELHATPKTVDQFVEKKPGAPDGETPPAQDSKRPPATKKASPQARVLAEQNGIDLSEITGSGKNGMVRVADVRAAIEKRAEIEAAKAEAPKAEAPNTVKPTTVSPAKTEAPKTEAPKTVKPTTVSPAKTDTPKADTPKVSTPVRVAPAKTEAPKTETPKTEAPKTEAPKPTTVVPAETQTPVEGAPAGLSIAQQSRIPKALAGLSGKSVGAVYQTLIDTLLPGGERARYVGNDGAFNRSGRLKESLQNLLLTFDKADILYVLGRGLAKENNQFMNNGSTDVRLRRGYSMVSIDPATKAELRGTPGLLPADKRITQKTVAEAQQRMIYFRTAQAVFDQMAYSRATSEWINRGRKGNSDQGSILAEIYDQLGKRGGLKPTDIAALRRRAYDLYYDKAIEYGIIHDNYRTITTTTTDMVGDRIAELRSRVALASVREKTARTKTEISGEQFTEMLKAEQAAIDKMDSIRDLAEKLYKKHYLSGEDVSDIISAEAQQKSYALAGAAETERAYQYEEQASTGDRHGDPDPVATIFNQAAEDSMMQGFRRWAEYQMMRDIFAYSRLMKALGKNTADTYKGTDFDLIASAVLPGLNATLSPEMIYSKRSASDIMKKDTTVQSIQNEITGTMREWATNNFWTSEPRFGREGKRTDLVEKYLEELFETARGHAEALVTAKEDLTAAQNEARQLARVLRDYNRAGDLGVDPTIGAAEAVIEAESKAKEETAERISRQTQGRSAPEDEANIVNQVEEEADRGVYESGRDEDEGANDEYEGLRATEDPTIDASLSESDAEELGGSYTMDDDLSLQQESYQFDPLYKAIVEEELRNRGITSKEDADPRLVSEALWEAGIRYERRTGSVDPDAYLDDPRFAETLKNVLEKREIPPEPKVGTAAQVKWEEKYGYKYKKAFNDAVTKYRDETRGEGPRKMYGEPIRQRLVETNFRIKELRKTVANRESRAKFYAKNADNYKTVPGGASLYLLQNLTERVGLGVMTPEQAMNATRAARLLWAKDNTITADQILGIRSDMFSADPARQVDELLKAARRVDLNKIGDKLYRDAVDRAIANNKKGYKGTTANYDDVEVLHDLVADGDVVAEESETARVNRRAEVVKALDEAGKTEANDANNIRAEVVRDLRAEGATELTAPVGYTEKTRQHKVTPDTLAREAEEAKSGKPIRVPMRDSSSVAKMYGPDDINVGQPYSKKRKKLSLSKTPKEILHAIDRLVFNDCEAVSRAGMKQTRLDNLNNHITLVRGASATANAILTDALVDPNGNVIGSSFADVFLCRDKIHPRQIDRDAQNTLEKYFLLNMTVDRMSAEVRADRAVEDYEALYPEVRKLTPDQIKQYRNSNPIIGKYAQLLLWQRGAKNKPVLAVNDTFDDGTPIPLSAEDAQRMLNQLQSENPWLQAKADAFYDWWDLFMRTYVVGGAVSEQDYDNIRNAAPHYVPTHREGSTGAFVKEYSEMLSSFSKTMNVGAALKPAKGSTKRIEPIADQLASIISTYVKSYRSRMLVNNFFDELLVDDDGNFAEFGRIVWSKTDPIFQQANAADSDDAGAAVGKVDGEDGGYYLATWRDGKKIVAHITEGMYHSMNNLIGKGYQKVQGLMDFFNTTTTPMKMAITGVNVFFAGRNIARDVPTAFVNTENRFLSYGRGWIEACAHIAQNSDLWRVYCALGGEHANINYRKKGLVNAIDDPKLLKRVAEGTINVLSVIGETSESVTRFAEFLATIRRMGDTPTTRMIAMHRAAEVTVDFSRAGWAARFANSWQPYFNPAIQGIAKVFRSVFESKTPGKTIGFNGKTAAKGLLWAILPEILFGLWRKAKNKEKEFNQLSDYVKDNYYMIPAGDHDWIRIAKTREWAAVFGNAVMRLMEGSTGYERPFETYWDISIKGNFLPELPVGLLAQWGWQLARNENYAGSVIIPKTFDEFKQTHPMDVYDEDTSAVAYIIASLASKVWAELNPMAVDYLLNSYFGDFYSQIWEGLTWMNVQRWTDGEYGFWDLAEDSFQMLLENTQQVFITDDRYSNSTVTRYYEMYSQLRSDVASAKYKNGGATGSLDEAVLAALSDQRYGYSALIQKLAKEARSLPNGEEKDQIKGQIVVLAGLAQDFYNRCMSGEITDPERYIKYSILGGEVCNELIWLGEPDDGYNPEDIDFDPTFSCPAYLRDPNNPNKQFKITGDEGLRAEFISAYEANFAEAATALIRSSSYQSLSKTAKAAAMQQQESYALAQTKSEFAELLKKRGIRSESKTITSVELAKVEAEYVLQGINNPNLAIDDDVVGELVALDSYASKYSFVLSTNVPATFRSQTDSDYVYNLNSRQQTYYATTRAALYNDAMLSVITSERYGKAKPQERAAMLEVACGYVEKELKDKMQKLLDSENAKPTMRVSTSEELIDEEAKYSVARILSPDDAYDTEVTDELLRLYGLSDEYSFQPPTTKPVSYVDPDDRDKEYILTEEQREKYVEISHATYNDAVLTIITDPSYARLTDAQKAERLNAMRSKLAEVVRNEFLLWLSQNTTSTDREDPKVSKETAAYVKKLLGW